MARPDAEAFDVALEGDRMCDADAARLACGPFRRALNRHE